MNTLVPPLPHRFDHLEIATFDMPATEALFARLGFYTTQVRTAELLNQKLMIQGRVRVLLSLGRVGTYQHEYVQKNGEGVCAIGYHVESAKKALHLLRQQKSVVAQEFLNDETDERFLQSSAVFAAWGMRVTFVTRSGAPHDVLSPFAPGFAKLANAEPDFGVGLLTFLGLQEPGLDKKLRMTFACADTQKAIAELRLRGLQVIDDLEEGAISIFENNPVAQLVLHFKKS